MTENLLEDDEYVLKHELVSLLNDNKEGKRNGCIEELQLKLTKNALIRLSSKYEENVVFDFDGWNTLIAVNSWYITYDGDIKLMSDGYNEWYDGKKFDAGLNMTINGKSFIIFFILKGVQNKGGHQRNVKQEIGLYTKEIQRNKDDNTHFFFVMDGDYINTRINELDKCDKYDFSTTNTIEEVINNFIIKNLN